MRVENWLRSKFQGYGQLIEHDVLEGAVDSVMDITAQSLLEINLTDERRDHKGDVEFLKSCDYALSTLYYSMSAATAGGTQSEKRGNRQISIGGKAIDVATRAAWRAEADRLRRKWGFDIEEATLDSGGMFDATDLRKRSL